MEVKFLKRSAFLALLSILVAMSVFSAATYAWFTANSKVFTSRIEASTDRAELRLYVKAPDDASFEGSECELSFGAEQITLLPVSTADLQNFVYCPGMASDKAEIFRQIEDLNEQTLLAYGAVDMRAELDGVSAAKVAVYLDQPEDFGLLAEASEEDSLLLNAARLGLMLRGDADTAHIFYLSDEHNDEEEQVLNTVIDGELQEDDIVLESDGSGNVSPVPDPALPLGACMLTDGEKPGEPLFYLEAGKDYTIDVFFYLEGCDPDCSDSVAYDTADLALAFYATLAPEG